MIPLSLGYSSGRSKSVNAGINLNVYPQINGDDAKATLTLAERPGLKRYIQPATSGKVKAMIMAEGSLYSIIGDKLYRGTTELHTTSPVAVSPRAWMASNANRQILIVNGYKPYVYSIATNTLTAVTDITNLSGVGYLDQYGIASLLDTGKLYHSTLNNFLSWGALDFVSAEALPDVILSILVDHQEILAFGETTVEIFRNSGDADAVLQRVDGTTIEVGTAAAASHQITLAF